MNTSAMLKLGELLIMEGVITQSDHDRARLIQSRRGGRLGPILVDLGVVTQQTVDEVWRRKAVTPILEAAIDKYCGGSFTKITARSVNFIKLVRKEVITEDLMSGARFCGLELTIHGEATLQIGQAVSLPIEFTVDETSQSATLSSAGEAVARRWVALITRNQKVA